MDFFHLHKIFYTLVIFGSFNIFIFSCIKIYHNKNNKKMSGKSNIKVSDLNIPAAEEEKTKSITFVLRISYVKYGTQDRLEKR